MKICILCEVEKAENEFVKNKNKKDGLEPRCKECSRVSREMVIDSQAGKVFWKYSNGMLKEIGTKYNNGYLHIQINKKKIQIHRLIYQTYHNLKLKQTDVVDHINRNRLDNRIKNLRLVTQKENTQNVSKQKNTSSKYKGVSLHKQSNKWTAQIMHNLKITYLGFFDNEEDAARAYNQKAEELNNQGACYSLNEI